MYRRVRPRWPSAVADIRGTGEYDAVRGVMKLYQRPGGVLVEVSFASLPQGHDLCAQPIFGFHIHSGTSCTGNADDDFADAGTHYNPKNCPHPYHAGDMPPLFSANGKAYLAFVTDRFTVHDVVGKTVILHDRPDDFTTQPSGNAGNKIACGVIKAVGR